MPPSKISTASRSKGVSMRGGRKTKKSNYYGKKKFAPTYYIPRATARYGLTMSRARNSYAPSVSKASNSIPKYTLAVVRPFSDNAIGAKVPDMNSMPSATSFSREIVSPKLNQSGYSFTAYRFQHTCTTINGTSSTGMTASWPSIGSSFTNPSTGGDSYGLEGLNYTATPNGRGYATQDPCYQSMIANYLDTRTVSCGIRVQCNLPALTACGFIHIACVPEDMLGSTWQYPTTFAAMERAPFYQKVPLANLINNQANINLPIMDQGAWRYRNTGLLPSNVGASFVQSTTAASGGGTAPVQLTQQSAVSLDANGNATVTFGVPFISQPTVTLTNNSTSASVIDNSITACTNTGFSVHSDQDAGGTAGAANWQGVVNWTATGFVTPANYAAFTPDGGEALTVQNIQLSTIPGIETTYGWGACIVALEMGAFAPNGTQTVAQTSPIEVEVIRHYEAIPNDNVGNIITGTAAERHSDAVLTGTKNVQSMTGAIQIDPDSGGDGGSSVSPSFADKIRACTNWAADVASAMHPVASVVVQGVRGMQSYIRGRQARGYAYRKVVVKRTD